MSITVSSFYFKNTVTYIKDRYVESTAAKVINHNGMVVAFINTIRQRCSSRLVDDTENFQACDTAGIFSCLTLTVREVSRNSNNCLSYFFT